MAKRTSRNSEGAPSKRPRTDDFADLWGEDLDLDEDVIDDCFKLATQVIEQKNITCTQLNNVSILPTYNAFKGQRNLFSSTQSAPEVNNYHRATTSTFSRTFNRNNSLPKEVVTSDNDDGKLKQLQEQILAKEGEVAILRSQLKEVKANFEVENAKKQKEWLEKLNEKTKEIREIQSKLEFKDLEIISLKQKSTEITKVNNLNLSFTQEFVKLKQDLKLNDKSYTTKEKIVNPKIQPVIEKQCPLQQIIPLCIFNVVEQEKYFVRNKRNEKPPTLFHSPLSQFVADENESQSSTHNKHLNLSCVFPEIGTLLASTATEIEESTVIQKVFNVSFTLLHTFLAYLKQVEQNSRTEDLIQADVVYLGQKSLQVSDVSVFDGRDMCKNEIGINIRQSIAFIAELIPYISNLREYLNDLVTLDIECVPLVSGRFLEILLECVTLIGKLRLSSVCVGVFCAVIRLLTNLEKCCYEKFGDLVELLFKEIVLARPEINVLLELSFFLKAASHNADFIKSLCTMHPESVLKLNTKEGYFTYNQNTCLFHVLSALYENCLEYSKGDLLLKMCENYLCFLHNAITQNSLWLYCKEQETCKCLYMAIKLSIEFINRCLNDYKNNKNDSSLLKYSKVFSLSVKLLHIINFKMCTVLEKYITMYASFVEAVKKLHECRFEVQWEEEISKLLESLIPVDVEECEVNVAVETFNSVCLCDDLKE